MPSVSANEKRLIRDVEFLSVTATNLAVSAKLHEMYDTIRCMIKIKKKKKHKTSVYSNCLRWLEKIFHYTCRRV